MCRRRRALPALLALLVTAVVPASPAAAQEHGDPGGFHDVLAVGQGGSTSPTDLAAFLAGGTVPRSFVNQREMYTGLVPRLPGLTSADLPFLFKPERFGIADADRVEEISPRPGVVIARDRTYEVPSVRGETRADVMFGAGYAIARDRLFMMDVLRSYGRAELTNLAGAEAGLEMDLEQFRASDYSEADLQRQVDEGVARAGAEGAAIRSDLEEYTAGVNAFIADARANPALMPAEYPAIGRTPRAWKLTDSVAVASLIGGIFGRGGGKEAEWSQVLAAARHRFRSRTEAFEVLHDFANLDDPEASVSYPGRFPFDDPGRPSARTFRTLDRGSLVQEDLVASDSGGGSGGDQGGGERRGRVLPRGFTFPGESSNALLVDARRSATGRPLALMGPQVGYYSPEILMEIDLHGGGVDARGVVFPGASPYVLLGRGRNYAWSATTPNSDNVDDFVVDLCEPDGSRPTLRSQHYRVGRRCVPFQVSERRLSDGPTPTAPTRPSRDITLRIYRSRYGPIQSRATVGGRPVAIAENRSTYLREIDAVVAFKRLNLNEVGSRREFVRTMPRVGFTFNWYYAGRDGIAHLQSGFFPRRPRGAHPSLPIRGDGRHDWRGFDAERRTFRRIPDRRLPQTVAPRGGTIVNWNNRIARGWRASDDVPWKGSVDRNELFTRLTSRLLRTGDRKIDPVELVRVMGTGATQDLRGVQNLPLLRRLVGRPGGELRDALARLERWRRDGAHRRDVDGDNQYEHPAAVMLMDAWWDRLVPAMFRPVLGGETFDALRALDDGPPLRLYSARPNLPLSTNGSAFGTGFMSYVDKDLRALLGRRVRGPLSRRYCGRGSVNRCRAILRRTLQEAVDEVQARSGGSLDGAQMPATCEVSEDPDRKNCDQTELTTTGAIETPPFPYQNRPTFQQLVEVGGRAGMP